MKLLFQQRFFSWLDSYDIYDEAGRTLYSVEGRLAWGHKLVIFDASGREVGLVREEVMTFLPRFTLSVQGRSIGQVCKEWTFFKPSYRLDCLGWQVQGDWLAWDYTICDPGGAPIATISKQIFNWTDTYVLDVAQEGYALYVLMVALAIDAAQCTQGKG